LRKLIWTMTGSLDGYMAGPNRELDWHMVDEAVHSHMNQWLGRAGLFIEGRVTYELMEDFWPTADAEPGASATVVEFAQIWRDVPKLVFSRTLEQAGPNAQITRDVVPSEIVALKQQPGGDLVIGGADLASTFIRYDLVDEYRYYVDPIIIGRGMPMFLSSDNLFRLQLVENHTFDNGVVMLRYDRATMRAATTEER
jgi:dihydrofolate reductase